MLVQGSWVHLAMPLLSMCQQVHSINVLIYKMLLRYDAINILNLVSSSYVFVYIFRSLECQKRRIQFWGCASRNTIWKASIGP